MRTSLSPLYILSELFLFLYFISTLIEKFLKASCNLKTDFRLVIDCFSFLGILKQEP